MKADQRPQFFALLSRTFRTARAEVPEPDVIDVWWAKLAPFPIEAVAAAFAKHLDESEYAPTPAAILRHLPRPVDGRPHADEAWAIALNARSERETVVWTAETAQAWNMVSALAASDEVGARMAFRAAYTRLVDDAIAHNVPARWLVSPGHDPQRRIEVVDAAVRAGRLTLADARAAVPALPAPTAERDGPPSDAQMQARARLREIVGGIVATQERRLAERQRSAESAADATAARKREIDEQTRAYASAHGIRQREPGDDDEVPA